MSNCNRSCLRRVSALFFLVSVFGASVPAHASRWDFEDGNLDGWTATLGAFLNQPTYGDNVAARLPASTSNQQGQWWIGTFENRHTPAEPAGRAQGDGPQGQLVSPSFSIENPQISFLIGGGNDAINERVALIVPLAPGEPPPTRPQDLFSLADGIYKVVLTETGTNDDRMRRVTWDVSSLLHRSARIVIVDSSSATFGHINVDDFTGVASGGSTSGLGTAVVVNPGSSKPAGEIPRAGTSAPGAIALPPMPIPGMNQRPQLVQPVDAPQPPAGAPSAFFRLYLTGFRVIRQTNDDPLEYDGVGDEVYFRGDIFAFANGNFPLGESTVRSGAFGSNFALNVGGGRGGGIVTGDIYPRPDPFSTAAASRRHGDLAIKLWEGLLIRGYHLVVVAPSVWEWDNEEVSSSQRDWMDQLHRRLDAVRPDLTALTNNWPTTRLEPDDYELLTFLDIYNEGTAPFGAKKRVTDFPNWWKSMVQPVVILTYDSALQAASSRYRENYVIRDPEYRRVTDGPLLAPGVIPLEVSDFWSHGEYVLYLKLERVP